MYKAFIVDDEPSVLEGLKVMIPWSELDLELCGESSNVQDALLQIKVLRPHLIITDIRMPQKNGLELINEVRKLDITVEFIILSGYSEFAYAQEAMRNQVSYYLLKPIDRDEIISVLLKIKDKLDSAFLTSYGFSQSDIEEIKERIQSVHNSNNGITKGEIKGALLKPFNDNFDEELTSALRLMNCRDAEKLIDELFNFLKSRDISPAHARIIINSCIYHILHIAFERNIKLNTILPPERNGKWDLDELKSYITDILFKTINLMLEDRRKNSRSHLHEVKEYIEKNFNKKISVSFLSKLVFLEAGYLGDAFRNQFGLSISEYQHRLRIEKAAEMIRATSMKLNDISAAVGYNNYNNFFLHFERITGKKPTEYRNNLRPLQ